MSTQLEPPAHADLVPLATARAAAEIMQALASPSRVRILGRLRWALDEARRRGLPVRVVHAWTFPYTEGEIAQLARRDPPTSRSKRVARALLDGVLRRAGDASNGIDMEGIVAEGPPPRALLEAAADAELLVVGSRGHGGFTGLLLGSVSQPCAQHAPCPVVIVREPGHS